MRLLNATTLELVSFADDQIPPYAILSHTWDTSPANEVSFHDVLVYGAMRPTSTSAGGGHGHGHEGWDGDRDRDENGDEDKHVPQKKPSWAKIKGACAMSLARGCEHIWIDTCCIDKSSSAEMQESINSMFRWYSNADVCLAFLSDVAYSTRTTTSPEDQEDNEVDGIVLALRNLNASDSAFRRARWFTRGWTLQELLAPATVEFFSQDWRSLGTKDSLSDLIQDITGIPSRYLNWKNHQDGNLSWGVGSGHGHGDLRRLLSRASVAERMSWAANRQTTRVEDTAYCLLGLFGVCMPMLYGEDDRAFARLQEEIMRETDDCTALSWGYGQPWSDRADAGTILAPNPAAFRHCGGLVPTRLGDKFRRPRFSLGQQGFTLSLPLKDDRNYDRVVYAILACGPPSVSESESDSESLVAIPLISVSACDDLSGTLWKEPNEYLRYGWCTPVLVHPDFLSGADARTIVIRRPSPVYESLHNLPIRIKAPRDYVLVETYPPQPTYPVIGTCFVDVGRSSCSSRFARWPVRSTLGEGDDGDDSGSPSREQQQQQQMMHIRADLLGDLLVSITFTPESTNPSQKESTRINCRVFKLPSSRFDLQLLHDWAAKDDSTATLLREVPGAARSDMSTIFRVNGRNRSVLAIQIKEQFGDGAVGATTSVISIFKDGDWGAA